MNAKAKKDTPVEQQAQPGSKLISMMAHDANLDANMYASTVQATCFDGTASREQFVAFLMIAHEHDLNPITREIYAFSKGGKITPIVSIDGWLKIINSHPQFDGMQFEDHLDDDGGLVAITCKIFRKDRKMPTQVTEYLEECKRDTQPWNQWPIRMLRHKSTIQCARYAFGFSGIVDADEAERIKEAGVLDGVAQVVDEEVPQNAAARLISKIKPQVEETDLAPETETSEPVEVKTREIIKDDGEVVTVEDIPGLQKGSDIEPPGEELSDGHKEWIEDMEKADEKK